MSAALAVETMIEAVSASISIINAYMQYDQYTETRDVLEDVIDTYIEFGDELAVIERKNRDRQRGYWQLVWSDETREDLIYKSCDNKLDRANISQRWKNASYRDALLNGTNMHSVGLREDYINRSLSADTHSHSQTYNSALYHEDNQTFETWDKYTTFVLSMMKNVPYGNLPSFLGRVGDGYEGLMRMHAVSMNNSIASAVGSIDRIVNSDSAVTSRTMNSQDFREFDSGYTVSERSQDYEIYDNMRGYQSYSTVNDDTVYNFDWSSNGN